MKLFHISKMRGKIIMNYGVSFSMTDLEGVRKSPEEHEEATVTSQSGEKLTCEEAPSTTTLNETNNEEEKSSEKEEVMKEPVHHYLFPEEALYLHMLGLVVILGGEKDDEDMTTKDLYLRFFCTRSVDYGITLPVYLSYMHLRSQSYIVARHGLLLNSIECKTEEIESVAESTASTTDANAPTVESVEDKLREERIRKKIDRLNRIDRAIQHPPTQFHSNGEVSLAYDVWKPNSNFKKTNPGRPDFCVAVGYFNSPSPPLSMLLSLITQCNGAPLRVAVISDSGTVMLFSFSDEEAPVILDRQERW
uniref:tRNA-splicing endonuclease subunit Sen54 N-terminal domain-containing protein n=1 Tax=Leptocylindrus danicus TaxID=163516 RepID=A0A7S2K865_9STRA